MTNGVDFDRFADTYDDDLDSALSVSGEGREFFARERIAWLAQCLSPLRQSVDYVLDYGCGTGDTTVLLRELLGCKGMIGLDISIRSLAHARCNHGSDSCRFVTPDEHVPDGSIDVVYCNGVFHHIPVAERRGVVDYIYRCLRPGGIFALWENNPWNLGTRYVMRRCSFDRNAIKISPLTSSRLLARGGSGERLHPEA